MQNTPNSSYDLQATSPTPYSNNAFDQPLGIAYVVFSFSGLKYFVECPYQFKLDILYGFNAPIHEALGYGQSLHDALAEVHARAIRGDVADAGEGPRLVEAHLTRRTHTLECRLVGAGVHRRADMDTP